MAVCKTDRLYHYLLGGDSVLDSIRQQGLLPLSDLPPVEHWHETMAFYRALYEGLVQPYLKKPWVNSGVFLTPIDFRAIPGSLLANRTRVAVPLSAIPVDSAVLTYQTDGPRTGMACTAENLKATADRWTAEMVQTWFGRDRTKLFFHVPQVAVYQLGGLRIDPAWIEHPA